MESAEVLLGQGGNVGMSSSVHHGLDPNLLQLPNLSGHGGNVNNSGGGTGGGGSGSGGNPVPTNALTFTETQNGIDVMHHMKKMRDTERYCDVVLYVQGKKFKAHRNILAACSPYFSSIFKSQRTIRETIAITCQEPEVFQMFLNYIYTGTVTIEKSNVGELLRLANHFLMVRLKGYCGEYLERFLDAENCLSMKDIAEKFSMTELAKTATNFVRNNLGDVINHEVMMDLPVKQIEKFVTEKEWNVPMDAAVKIMSRWVCHDLPTRERDFKHLLTNINWNLIDPNVIVDYIDQEPLYGSSERCFYYVLHSLAEKGIQVQKYEQMYQALQQRFGQENDQTLGFGDNLLQMAFNSAMEGLQVPADSTILMPDGREVRLWGNKWYPTDVPRPKTKKPKSKLPLTIEQRRKRYLSQIRRDRKKKKWVVVRTDNPKRRHLKPDELVADSSGDEECDPFQTNDGYRCHMCPFYSKKVSKLERHLAIVHAHDVTYRCSECGFTCKWNREYFVHMKSHYEGPPFKCQACEYSCMKIGSLIAHKITHLDIKPFQCSECDFKCRSKANLAAHMKTHNNEKPYKCSTCSRSFANRNTLEQHMATHNPDKTYSCSQCSFTTKYLNHFSTHKKSHQNHTVTAAAPVTKKVNNNNNNNNNNTSNKSSVTNKVYKGELYRCQDSNCKYTTNKKSQLDSHMRSHAGVRPHICTICGRRFLEKSHLVRHERIHYNERPFKCEECDYASTRRDKLKEHKTRHHGINASAKSPYKPRPHKSNKPGSSSSSDQGSSSVVFAKKSSAQNQQQQAPATATSVSSAVQQQHQQQTQAQQDQTAVATAVANASGELEFIIPHTHLSGNDGGNAAYAQLNASSIDLHQLSNAGGIVQLRPFQPGKPEIQVAHTLASIPTLTPNDLSRQLGVKIEDLQAQGIIGIQQGGGRAIKLEEITGVSTQGGIVTGARVHGQPGTMIIDAAQLQQIAQAAAAAGNSGPIPIAISSASSGNQSNNNQGNQSNDFGLSTLLY